MMHDHVRREMRAIELEMARLDEQIGSPDSDIAEIEMRLWQLKERIAQLRALARRDGPAGRPPRPD